MISRFKHLKVFFADPDKKSGLTILKEVIHFTYLKKMLPTDYFRKFLYRKDIKNYTEYLSIKEHYSMIASKNMVFLEISALLNNKLSFKLICKEQGFPIPDLISYNFKNIFFFDKKVHTISNKKELVSLFKNILNSDTTHKIFFKPINGIGGVGCFLVTSQNLEDQINQYAETVLTNSYIQEKYIEQHTEINKIHPHAVNTLRLVHYIDHNFTVHILSTFMRFGVGKSITDNTSTGGFSIAVHSETGRLEGPGRQEATRGAAVFNEHPDSKFKLEGFSIPYFKEACALVKEVAHYFPNRIVGWDVAISNKGPVIIEGNHNPGLHVSDIAYGGYGKHPLMKEILNKSKHK